MRRNHEKLINEYDKRALTNRRFALSLNDINAIVEHVNKDNYSEDRLFNTILAAYKVGIMIGYRARKAEEKQN